MSIKLGSSYLRQRQMPRQLINVFGGMAVVIIFLYIAMSNRRVSPDSLPTTRLADSVHRSGVLPGPTTAMAELLKVLYRPSVHSITEPSFTDENGTVYNITGEPGFKKSLGKRLLILDVDTRNMTGEGCILNEEGVKWPGTEPMTAGILSHYLYCNCYPTS